MKAMLVHSTPFKKKGNEYFSNVFSYTICKERYLEYFDELHIFGRVEEISSTENTSKSSGPKIKHNEMPNMLSPLKMWTLRKQVYEKFYNHIKAERIDVLIARIPSEYSILAIKAAERLGVEITIEMVGDPFDATWNHGTLKGKIYAPFTFYRYKKLLKGIDNTIFVTEHYLQHRYKKDFESINSTNISNVNLIKDNNFQLKAKLLDEPLGKKGTIKIGTIGSYTSKYKGFDSAIRYARILRDAGYDAELHILGTGNKEYIHSLIIKNNMKNYVFLDNPVKAGLGVYNWLDQFDIYIQPSLTEGLPRGLIEAMSRGLPAIGTKVGGIPELLNKNNLVDINSPDEMFEITEQLINDTSLYNKTVKENYLKSQNYTPYLLNEKRDKFWINVFEGMN